MKKGAKNPILFENDQYRITKIPLNYVISVKILVKGTKRHKMVKLLPESFYASDSGSLEDAKALAEHMIHKYENLPTN